MVENRKFIRLRAPLPVEYRSMSKHKKQKKFSSLMKNISVGGLSLVVKEPVRAGDLIQVRIDVPHLEEPVSVVGDVVWHFSAKREQGPVHEAGIRFQEVNPSELNKILDYVYTVAIG